MRISLAFRVWWKVLTDHSFAARMDRLLTSTPVPEPGPESQPKPRQVSKTAATAASGRSEAVTLLAALQREARFIDMVKEPLDNYSDAQVGAAARDVLRDCGTVLDRMFQLQPVLEQAEGTTVEVPAGFDAGRYRLRGQVEGQAPFRGQLVHHGWQARTCQLPKWTGKATSQWIIAPVEVEVSASALEDGGEQ